MAAAYNLFEYKTRQQATGKLSHAEQVLTREQRDGQLRLGR